MGEVVASQLRAVSITTLPVSLIDIVYSRTYLMTAVTRRRHLPGHVLLRVFISKYLLRRPVLRPDDPIIFSLCHLPLGLPHHVPALLD